MTPTPTRVKGDRRSELRGLLERASIQLRSTRDPSYDGAVALEVVSALLRALIAIEEAKTPAEVEG